MMFAMSVSLVYCVLCIVFFGHINHSTHCQLSFILFKKHSDFLSPFYQLCEFVVGKNVWKKEMITCKCYLMATLIYVVVVSWHGVSV